MKGLKFLAAAALMLASTASFAQGAATYGKNSGYVEGGINIFKKQNFSILGIDPAEKETEGGGSVGFGYNRYIPLSSTVPFYLEAGAGLQFSSSKTTYDVTSPYTLNQEATNTLTTLKIPVSLGYEIRSSEKFSWAPYVGVDFRFNLDGKCELKETSGNTERTTTIKYFDDVKNEDGSIAFKKGNRFQFGGHVGVNFNIKRFIVGIAYQHSFTKLIDRTYQDEDKDGKEITKKQHLKDSYVMTSFGIRF